RCFRSLQKRIFKRLQLHHGDLPIAGFFCTGGRGGKGRRILSFLRNAVSKQGTLPLLSIFQEGIPLRIKAKGSFIRNTLPRLIGTDLVGNTAFKFRRYSRRQNLLPEMGSSREVGIFPAPQLVVLLFPP